jgi:outer membrane protein with beta-barrel domain
MKQATAVAPFVILLATCSIPGKVLLASQPGEFSFIAGIGESGTKSDNSYRSDQTLGFALQYQKSGYAAYRASTGFFALSGRETISPSIGTRDANAFFLTGDVLFTPRFRMVNPYVAGGVGFYDVRLTDDRDTRNDVEIGINWGIGVNVQLLRWFAIHGELAYHYMTGDISNPVQLITVGGRFDF